MKKILLFIVALVATLSMNAQTTEIHNETGKVASYYGADVTVSFGVDGSKPTLEVYKGGELQKTYTGSEYKVVSKELPPPPAGSTGTGKTKDGVEVNYVQLWKDGPKFAEYNVGAANNKAEDYGGYYGWGKTVDKDASGAYKSGTDPLTGDDDTATKLWGGNWCMPTKDELQALIDNCDVQWTNNYNGTGKAGRIFTGKGDYISNSIFLPAAGYCYDGNANTQGDHGSYWSSTSSGSILAYRLFFDSGDQHVDGYGSRNNGYSVRAVLKEPTTGTAKATINSSEVDVNWVQLWAGGPKFADRNVGASSATDAGTAMTFTDAVKTGTEYVWGANWCTPSKEGEDDGMNELLLAAQGNSNSKVTCQYCEYSTGDGKWGFKFTGKETGYTGNSVFFPAGGDSDGFAYYWSGTANGNENAWYMGLIYNETLKSVWGSGNQADADPYLVRPVFKN